MNKKQFIVLLLLVCSLPLVWSQKANNQQVAFVMTDLKTGKTFAHTNSKSSMIPASIVKLITTATALEVLGDDFQFKTEVLIDGTIKSDTLIGNLIVRAGGDPTLGSIYTGDSTFLADWCDAITRLGIRHIEGNLIADVSIFDKQAIPKNWGSPDVGNYYAAGVYGLSFYDNTLSVAYRSGRAGTRPQVIGWFPRVKGVTIDNRLTSKVGVGDNSYYSGAPYSLHRTAIGSIEANRERFVVRADNGNPPLSLMQALADSLAGRGVNYSGKVQVIDNRYSKNHLSEMLLFSSFSPKLSDIVSVVNVYSNNMFAEYLLKYLSLQRAKQGNFLKGVDVVKDFWANKGFDVSKWKLYDGSGLTRGNRLTAESLNELLIYMHSKSIHSQLYFESLPVAGINGTVHNVLKNTPIEGKAHLKSGSMSGVQCYAGYIERDDRRYSIVVIVNGFTGRRRDTVAMIERLILKEVEQYERTNP